MRIRLPFSFSARLVLTYMVLLGASVLLLTLFVYWATTAYMSRQTDAVIEAEISGLAERYELTGVTGLISVINDRLSRQPTGLSVYLLATPDYSPLAGNLDRWPAAPADDKGWIGLLIESTEGEVEVVHQGRAQRFALSGGFHLLVGRDISPLVELERHIAVALSWGVGLTWLLGGVGGWWMSRRMARRIETINRTSREIMDGDLSRRMPLQGTHDELDRLAGNLNRMLDRIQSLMEDVRRVSDSIAHDLRTPLGRLHNRLDTLRTEVQSAGLDPGGVEQALAESEGLLATFNALLRIARIEAGRGTGDFVPVDLTTLVRDVADLYEPLTEAREQTLSVQVAPDVRVAGDPDLLFQALANLLDNALKYAPRGGQISVTLQRQGPETAELAVSDSGPGIPPSAHKQVFQRFFRLEASQSTPGTGLGLSLVNAVARLHRLQVEITDNEPGARVALRFKTLPDTEHSVSPRPGRSQAPAPGE